MKKLFFILQVSLFVAFNFFLLLTFYQAVTERAVTPGVGYNIPVYNSIEEFDPSLSRLNSIEKLGNYADSIAAKSTKAYPEIAAAIIRKRFYHGYSLYGFNENYMAMVLSKVTVQGLNAIVIPDDILKYPFAACSQQSIVLMDLLQSRGYVTRSVGFSGKETGHFCFEAYYNHSWHYFDTDKEPDEKVLAAYNRPSIAFLNQNPDVLLKAYSRYSEDYVFDVFTTYKYGTVNAFPAPKAIIFQKISKFLSYTMWFYFLLAFIVVRRKYKRLGMPKLVRSQRRPFIIKRSVPAYSAA